MMLSRPPPTALRRGISQVAARFRSSNGVLGSLSVLPSQGRNFSRGSNNEKGPKKPPTFATNKDSTSGQESTRLYRDDFADIGDEELAETYGVDFPGAIREARREQTSKRQGHRDTVDEWLRSMDYLTASEGSTEDLMGERRALSLEYETEEEREQFVKEIDDMVERQRIKDLNLEPHVDPFEDDGKPSAVAMEGPRYTINPNQLAHGEWGELLIRVDRNIKLWRGGRIQSYRALVIGGNLNGCAGFGTGKADAPREAVLAASRKCKRNIFFVDRYQTNALTRDLVGKSNSCKVVIRATNRGLRGNPLACEILKYFGITNATCKAVHGNRSQFNVVRATFKALMTHEGMEEISRKRGRRIVSIDRGRRLQL